MGKRIVVGGGATGIGAALVQRLVRDGASVAVGDINEPALQELVLKLTNDGAKALAIRFDLADGASIRSLVEQAADRLGGIDGLAIPGADVSMATLSHDRDILSGIDPKIWDRSFKVNVTGHALLMEAVIPHMVKSGGGAIVSVSSGSAYVGSKVMPAYAASKAALHALVRHVARTCGQHNIRCNAVAPGRVLTQTAKTNVDVVSNSFAVDALSLPRLGEPDDIASMLAFLLSDQASWITGQVISVNGGIAFRE